MATTSRAEDLDVRRSPLGEALREHPGRFNFFQIVRLIERMCSDKAPVGQFGPPDREALRFAVNNSLAFPPSQVHSLEWPEGQRPTVTVNFMGLTGPLGVLPWAMTELVRDRVRAKDRTLRDFFDLFNHRMISLFYQAWKKYRFFVAYERDQQDRFSKYLMSFVGLGTEGLQKRQPVRDESLLYYCGLLSLQPRSAIALEQVVSDYFGVPVEVEQFVGAWHSVSVADQCRLEGGIEFSEQLGVGAIAGDEVWSHESRLRLRLGPLTIDQYLDFLPPGKAYHPLQAMLRFFTGYEFEYEVELVLMRDDVPSCELGRSEQAMPFLGWTTWMKSAPVFDRNPADTVLLLQ
jgi:type VI secretion system protein ImpH